MPAQLRGQICAKSFAPESHFYDPLSTEATASMLELHVYVLSSFLCLRH